jgi:hydroxyacylglutathione hydrolase
MPPHVHVIRVWTSCAYLIESPGGLVLVDTTWPGNEARILHVMRQLRRSDLRLILITHAHLDHYGSAAALRRLTGAVVAIHYADAEPMARGQTPIRSARGLGKLGRFILRLAQRHLPVEAVQCDLTLRDGDDLRSFGLDVVGVVVHTPGHTAGSCTFFTEGRLAFVGDLLTNNSQPVLQRRYADDWSYLPKSLARVQALYPQWVYAGHAGSPLSGQAFQSLRPTLAPR